MIYDYDYASFFDPPARANAIYVLLTAFLRRLIPLGLSVSTDLVL